MFSDEEGTRIAGTADLGSAVTCNTSKKLRRKRHSSVVGATLPPPRSSTNKGDVAVLALSKACTVGRFTWSITSTAMVNACVHEELRQELTFPKKRGLAAQPCIDVGHLFRRWRLFESGTEIHHLHLGFMSLSWLVADRIRSEDNLLQDKHA